MRLRAFGNARKVKEGRDSVDVLVARGIVAPAPSTPSSSLVGIKARSGEVPFLRS